MIRISKVSKWLLLVSFICVAALGCSENKKTDLIKVLILSGRNNHEWQKTTPLLVKIFNDAGLFSTSVTESPDTLRYKDFRKFDVVVSNWNTWPDNNLRLPGVWEKDFVRYVKRGGGTVFIHAGASSFYGWPEYHRIGIGRWGKDTKHGQLTKARLCRFDQDHPVTRGLGDFYIIDEIWEKTDINPKARALATVNAKDEKDGHLIDEKAIFVSHTGRGRSFYTTLGHNERALLNSGLQTLILRGTQWVAGRSVTIDPPPEMRAGTAHENKNLNWTDSDTTLILKRDSDKIWQFNYNNRFGKPYFHPLCINNSVLTCANPADHPWHLGYWFSWKFINGVNYWEYLDNYKSEQTGYKSAGITEIARQKIIKNPDFSADLHLELNYHPEEGKTVLTESRNIHISKPFEDGSYFIDNEYLFTPLSEQVVLDRTPVEGEPDGKSWGGYAGLSVRFSQDYTSPAVIGSDEGESHRKDKWVYMGFNTLTGDTAGMCIFQDMKFTTSSTSWYIINNPEIPFYYYSPAILFDGKIILKKGENLHLKYRTWIIPGKPSGEMLQAKYDEYLKN